MVKGGGEVMIALLLIITSVRVGCQGVIRPLGSVSSSCLPPSPSGWRSCRRPPLSSSRTYPPLPHPSLRLEILQVASRRLAKEADVDLMWLAVNTENLTGEWS